MSNRQLITSAQFWVVAVLLACGLLAVVGKSGIPIGGQQGSNQNSNSNSNSKSSNENRTQKSNANNSNSGTSSASGERAAMGSMSSKDQDFVMEAAMGGMMEVELGRWAAQKGTSDAVKQFGQRMVDDHRKANAELMSLATSKGITLPTQLDEKHQAEVTKVSRLSGAAFDRAYSKLMLSDHNKDVAAFEQQSNEGGDPDIKAFATSTLATLKEHLQMARALNGKQSGKSDNTNSDKGSKNSNNNANRNSNRP